MPTGDVAVAHGFLQDGGGGVGKVCSSPEAKSGGLILVGPGKHTQHVQVKVYRTSLEHFAVVFPQKKVCRPLGFVNLRHTAVARLPAAGEKVPKVHVKGLTAHASGAGQGLPRQLQHLPGLVVRSRQCDSPNALTFLCEAPKELESWLSAFDPSRTATLQDAMRAQPILEESDEVS
ncbi:uncharacterized protein LOC113213023 [Frankliniella occidentalis]|uniref:Uncharacterized protein LOC113213023 n=1 Tax=Frankliniella occidentalis TaxID=133901 RepID=A0A6J1T443_FRAOC|nr:uncharacterized protein LOC113213023 [Frankliniella occidentalis]